ncbi:MAG: hypothetical protein R3C11_18525 [Planctomycetaceae bacterium]
MSYYLIDAVERLGKPRFSYWVISSGSLYLQGEADRISRKPQIILLEEQRETRLGGAANVANLLRGLEAEVTMAGTGQFRLRCP